MGKYYTHYHFSLNNLGKNEEQAVAMADKESLSYAVASAASQCCSLVAHKATYLQFKHRAKAPDLRMVRALSIRIL
jgi:hypothetical protein